MSGPALLETHLSGVPVKRGKVRDVYDLGDRVLIVATDRISAFDVVMANGIPDKGRLLTGLAQFWFERFSQRVPHHLLSIAGDMFPAEFAPYATMLAGRTMLCEKATVVPIECVVRGYLAGSGWKEYQATGRVCGVPLPAGLRQGERLPEPIFTPATKSESGHDENITFEQASDRVGGETMRTLRERSLLIYREAAAYAESRGILIADTKFEFGHVEAWGGPSDSGTLILVDEVLTPDSSRFWPADRYQPGRDQASFDKQFVRDYLEGLCLAGKWDKSPPGPTLPDEVVAGTRARYIEAYERLTGRKFKS
ncbi:MAG: phosphoribosylaminoimidazolesuccinocarboxamide synthase [Phycisphaerae bacterium]|nr:phosphoribosylaminoimidazolesuccinocarboxamide synthase [Phycisphaerae bacterium]